MSLGHTLVALGGRLLRPIRAGSKKLVGSELAARTLTVESTAFRDGEPIPDAYAGPNGRSPALTWSRVPDETREIVVLCEDPDAPMPKPFVHWILYGVPPDVSELPEGLPPTQVPLAMGALQGRNSAHKDGYIGPMPPPGHGVHHYHFQVFAVDRTLELRSPVERDQLVRALEGRVVAMGEIVGTYERR